MIEIVIFLIFGIISLFILYTLSKHDFVLLRQNISTAQVFDIGFVSCIFSFALSRFLYIMNSFDFSLLSPIPFLHILRFPGISPLGFFLSILLFLAIILRGKKGLFRIYDIFFVALFPLYFLTFILRDYPFKILISLALAAVFICLFYFFIKSYKNYILSDGSITLLVLMLISFDTAIFELLAKQSKIILLFSPLAILSLITFFASLTMLIVNQRSRIK